MGAAPLVRAVSARGTRRNISRRKPQKRRPPYRQKHNRKETLMYRLQISYQLQSKNQDPLDYMTVTDKRMDKAVGAPSDGAGCGFGSRDVDWSFDTKAEAVAALKRIKALKVPKLQGGVTEEKHTTTQPATHNESLKYLLDGNKTIKDVIAEFRGLADHFEKLSKQGAKLVEPVDGGWINYEIPGHEVELECDEEGEPYDDQETICPICYKTSK
jgi:hypothetical protein